MNNRVHTFKFSYHLRLAPLFLPLHLLMLTLHLLMLRAAKAYLPAVSLNGSSSIMLVT